MNARIDFLGLQAVLSIAERGSFQRAAAQLVERMVKADSLARAKPSVPRLRRA